MRNITKTSDERACPVCGGTFYENFAKEHIDSHKVSDFTYASRKEPEFMCLRLVRCTNCDLVFAPTPPATNILSAAYSEAGFDSSEEAHAAAVSYAKALFPYVSQLAGRNAAVDVGAGSGPLLPWLQERGFSPVIGIEPSRSAINAAPPGVRAMLREGMFSPSLLADVVPSLICSFMTLEHLRDPGCFIDSAYQLLEPGGMLAVVVHNWRAPVNRILGLRSPIIDVEHLQLYSPKSLRTLLTRAGFVSTDLNSIANSYSLRYWLRLSPLPASVKKRLAETFNRMDLSNKKISLRVGNMLAICNKPLVEKL